MTLDRQLLEILRCPACRAPFADPADPAHPEELTCTGCGAAYPVRNGVPILLVDEARRPAGDGTQGG
jgi:uncharacterized protein YbaR (Trm112 family)